MLHLTRKNIYRFLILSSCLTLSLTVAGRDWQPMASGTTENLRDIWGVSATEVYAVGDEATILFFDGETWSAVDTGLIGSSEPNPPDFTTVQVKDGDVYIAGTNGWALRKTGTTWSRIANLPTNVNYRTSWAGPISDLVYFFTGNQGFSYDPGNKSVNNLAFFNDGSENPLFARAIFQGVSAFMDGTAFQLINTSTTPLEGIYINRRKIFAGSAVWPLNAAWAVSKNDIYVLGGDDGSSRRNTSGDPDSAIIGPSGWREIEPLLDIGYDIWADPTGKNVFAVGRTRFKTGGGITFSDGDQESNPNNTWSAELETTDFKVLRGVFGFTPDDVFAVGDMGTIYRSLSNPPIEIEISELRAIQSVLNTRTSDLVARKDLVLQIVASSDADDTDPIIPVIAELCPQYNELTDTCDAGQWLQQSGMVYPAEYKFSIEEYLEEKDSINFPIVGTWANNWLPVGTTTFKVNLYRGGDTAVEPIDSRTQAFTFRETQKLLIEAIAVSARPSKGYEVVSPKSAALDKADSLLRVFFPVDEENVTRVNIVFKEEGQGFIRTLNPIYDGPFEDEKDRLARQARLVNEAQGALLSDLSRRVIEDIQRKNESSKVIGIAVVAFDAPNIEDETQRRSLLGGFRFGYAVTHPDSKSGKQVGSYPVVVVMDGFVVEGEDDEGNPYRFEWSPASVAPHELGHLFGMGDEYCRKGAGACSELIEQPNPAPQNTTEGNHVGNYITQEQRAYKVEPTAFGVEAIISQTPPDSAGFYGYMGNAPDANKWTTSAEYEYLFGELCTTCSEQRELKTSAVIELQSRPVVNLIGFISETGVALLESLFTIDTNIELQPSIDSDYNLRFENDSGSLIGSYGFEPFTHMTVWTGLDHLELPLPDWPFVVSAPLPPGTRFVKVFLKDALLLKLERSDNPPTVVITAIDKLADGRIDVSWGATDPDGGKLEFSVYYSPDGHVSNLLYAGYRDTTAIIDLLSADGTGPTEQAYIKIIASDGFNSGEDQVILDFGEVTDRIALKQFNTRGPNIPGMCSRKNCIAMKRHTLVATNPSNESDATVSLEIEVVSTPDPACTVNSALQGGSVDVASDILLRSGSSGRFDVELRFECPQTLDLSLASDFLLEATVSLYGAIDPVQGNNSITKSQTVR